MYRIALLTVSFCFMFVVSSPVMGAQKEKSSDKTGNAAGEIGVIKTSLGTIKVKFFDQAGAAPKHVENFKKLANSGFYSGTTFHRVIPGFMIQGGDPNSKDDDRSNDGMGGPGYSIDAEFSSIKHERGIVSMARSQQPNSAGSQFFICTAAAPYLDGKYSVFGKVIEGMDVVDKIVSVKKDARDNPIKRVEMLKVSIENKK
ncbi:MAG: hypothetical protein IEMM0002_0485 [bacterium]|nr:MAG: hypothetical protein IEMM0002_0485 [bacterium]